MTLSIIQVHDQTKYLDLLLDCESLETGTNEASFGRVEKTQGELDAQARQWDPQSVWMGPNSVSCARLAAGSCLSVTSAVLEGRVACGVAVVRPPGHHCLSNRAMGFCLLNNVAVAARHALEAPAPNSVEKVMVSCWSICCGGFLVTINLLTKSWNTFADYRLGCSSRQRDATDFLR